MALALVQWTTSTKNVAFGFRLAIAAAGIVVASVPAAAEFYKGRTVTIMLGSSPVGSYHMYATLAANHLNSRR